eukprot:gene4534-6716_t
MVLPRCLSATPRVVAVLPDDPTAYRTGSARTDLAAVAWLDAGQAQAVFHPDDVVGVRD